MRTMLMAVGGIAISVAACYSPDTPVSSPTTNPLDEAPSAESTNSATNLTSDTKKNPFDDAQSKIALNRAAGNAHTCVDVATPDAPHGDTKVSVTFSGAGRSTKATIPPPFDGTPIGQCATRAFEGLIVPPFEGADVTVDQAVDLKPGAKPKPAGKKK